MCIGVRLDSIGCAEKLEDLGWFPKRPKLAGFMAIAGFPTHPFWLKRHAGKAMVSNNQKLFPWLCSLPTRILGPGPTVEIKEGGARTRSVMPHLRGGLTSRKEWGQNVLARAEVRMADNKFKREEWDRVLREGPSCLGSQASGQKVRLQRGPSCFRNGVVNGLAVGGPGQAAPIIRSDGLLRHLGFLASPSEADLPVPSAACWRCWSSHPARVTA